MAHDRANVLQSRMASDRTRLTVRRVAMQCMIWQANQLDRKQSIEKKSSGTLNMRAHMRMGEV